MRICHTPHSHATVYSIHARVAPILGYAANSEKHSWAMLFPFVCSPLDVSTVCLREEQVKPLPSWHVCGGPGIDHGMQEAAQNTERTRPHSGSTARQVCQINCGLLNKLCPLQQLYTYPSQRFRSSCPDAWLRPPRRCGAQPQRLDAQPLWLPVMRYPSRPLVCLCSSRGVSPQSAGSLQGSLYHLAHLLMQTYHHQEPWLCRWHPPVMPAGMSRVTASSAFE